MKTEFQVKNIKLCTGVPRICVPLVAKDLPTLGEALAAAKESPCDLVEFRADHLQDLTAGEEINTELLREALHMIRQQLGDMPVLFTVRTAAEGGACAVSDEVYEDLILEAARSGLIDLADVEMLRDEEMSRELVRRLHEAGMPVIGSNHHFEGTPPKEEIIRALVTMQELGADITKMAVMPHTRGDVLQMMDASVQMYERYADRPYVTMAMGELGLVTRVGCALTGSVFTFATAGIASAPGQIGAGLLKELLDS